MKTIEFKNKIDIVAFKVFGIFDIFRTNSLEIKIEEQTQIVLLLLSLHKDNFIYSETYFKPEHFGLASQSVYGSDTTKSDTFKFYQNVIQNINDSLSKVDDQTFKQLCNKLFEIDRQLLTQNFPEIFDNILYRISQSQGRFAGEFIQPVELTRFMCGLAEMKKDAKVFNPFAGLASFAVYLDKDQNYFGQERNQKTWTLGALRLMAYHRLGSSKYLCEDSILNWPNQSEKFDLIIANPPLDSIRQGHEVARGYRTSMQFLLEKGVQSLNLDGKLIALLPQSVLFNGLEEKHLRQYLIEHDLIDTIISLPGGLLLNTGVQLIILVLSRTKKSPGKVKLIDAKKFVITKGPKEKILNDQELLNHIRGNQIDDLLGHLTMANETAAVYSSGIGSLNKISSDEIERVIDLGQIKKFDYNLSIARYFQKEIEGVKLGDILELVRGQRGNLPETGKLIRIRDLKDDKVDFTLDISSVEETELRRPDIHLVSESCLLFAIRWRRLKPTLFEFKDEPIFRSQDILSFKVNESLADKAYLINELHADYVEKQLESYRLGASVMPFIRRDDLMEVIIKLPSIEEQRAKVQGIYELSDKIKSIQDERNALAHGKTIKQFNEFASLKHTLGRPRQNILDWSDNLLDFLSKKKEGFEALNKAFSEFYDIDIISALKEIKRDVNFITDVLEKGENGLVLSEYQKLIIPLSDINSIINELSNNGFNFKIKKLLLKGEKLKKKGVNANKTLFKTLLDNILTNANKYAFDKKATGNEVIIELTEIDDSLSIEIRNNGKPFPKNFDREKFITKYSTADSSNGSGLGGYDIHRIACEFNNPDWILSLNEDPFFLVKFKFQFPIKLIN
jgi:type I restriction enzyme M protein